MDERKIPLPEWLPWATTAVLAALVACIGELWILEKTKSQILRDDGALAAAELKAVNNQLEAERIVNQRELLESRSERGLAVLVAPRGTGSAACGAVTWDQFTKRGELTFFGLPQMAPDGDFQLWMSRFVTGQRPNSDPKYDWTTPASCGVFSPPLGRGPVKVGVSIEAPSRSGIIFTLTYGKKGGAYSLEEAIAEGSIVLATPTR
jgi:hypothetical protein